MPIDKLQSCDVVGLYFSGDGVDLHGGEPWRGFTPKLAKVYNKCIEEGNKLEIVLISWDDNEMEFRDYFGNHVLKPPKENYMTPSVDVIKSEVRFLDGSFTPLSERINHLATNEEYVHSVAMIASKYAAEGLNVLVVSD